jgi:hypothetical protein
LVDAADAAAEFVRGRSRADLDGDRLLLFALVRAVEVLGEAAAKVSEEGRSGLNLPWTAIVGMRTRLRARLLRRRPRRAVGDRAGFAAQAARDGGCGARSGCGWVTLDS